MLDVAQLKDEVRLNVVSCDNVAFGDSASITDGEGTVFY